MENNKEKLVVQKANQLVTAKYRASAMETKLMAIGLTRLEITNGIPKASIRAGELRTLFGNDDHNIYRKLKGQRGCTPITDFEFNRFLQLLQLKNNNNSFAIHKKHLY